MPEENTISFFLEGDKIWYCPEKKGRSFMKWKITEENNMKNFPIKAFWLLRIKLESDFICFVSRKCKFFSNKFAWKKKAQIS